MGYFIYFVFRYLVPLKVASKIGHFLGYYIIPHIPFTKKQAILNNIAYVFPTKSLTEIFHIYRLSCTNFVQNIFELPKLDRLKKYIVLDDPHSIYPYICNNQASVLLFTGHFGNWELIAPQFKSVPGYGIYKAPSNKYINKLFLRMRLQYHKNCRFRMIALNKKNIVKLLYRGKAKVLRLAMLVDQKVKEGILADFLGKQVYTTHLLPMLALKFKIPLIPIRVTRDFNTKSLRFIITIEKPLDISNLECNTNNILKVTEMMNNTMGNWIKENPAQWLWLYNRWKS